MINLFDHPTQQAMFFLQMFLEGLYDGVHVFGYRGIACFRLFIVTVDEREEHTKVTGTMLPKLLSVLVAFAAHFTSAFHIYVVFWNIVNTMTQIKMY